MEIIRYLEFNSRNSPNKERALERDQIVLIRRHALCL